MSYACPVEYIGDVERSEFNRGATSYNKSRLSTFLRPLKKETKKPEISLILSCVILMNKDREIRLFIYEL
jgi:hypothetical protein